MNKVLLFSLLLVSSFLSAQNWMPFNPNDSIIHFRSVDFVNAIDNSNFKRSMHPIQSVIKDNSYDDGLNQIITFKKGFSIFKLFERDSSMFGIPFKNKQKLAGKIFGDTLKITPTNTIIISSLQGISDVVYPKKIQLNHSWVIYNQITATIVSLTTKNIPGFGIDSIAEIQCNGITESIMLSKNHGLIKTIDFTDYPRISLYHRIDLKGEIIYQGDFYKMKVGDKYETKNTWNRSSSVNNSSSSGDLNNTYEFLNITDLNDTLNISVQRKAKGFRRDSSILTNLDTTYIENWKISKKDSITLKKSGLVDVDTTFIFPQFPIYSYETFLLGWLEGELRSPLYQIKRENILFDSLGRIFLESPSFNSSYNYSQTTINIGLNITESYSNNNSRFEPSEHSDQLVFALETGFPCDKNIQINSEYNKLTCNIANAKYQWFDCDSNKALLNDTSMVFNVRRSGNYKVIVNYNNGCIDTSSCISATLCVFPNIKREGSLFTCLVDSANYQWYNCSNGTKLQLPGETKRTYFATKPGCYQVQVTKQGCQQFSNEISFSCGFPSDSLIQSQNGNYVCTVDSARYQWYRCLDSLIPLIGDTNKQFSPIEPGSYSVSISKDSCTEISDCFAYVAINELKLTREVKVFPNPTSNTLNITSSSIVDQIEVRDLKGRIVMQLPYSNQINVSNLPTGVYFIQLVGDEIISQKFFKD